MVARESIAAIKDINIPSTEVYPRVGIHSTAVTNLAFHLSDL